MSSIIVGTAGHIDHGKSALVRALTGTDPDRLREEQERGLTIDLGFAFLGENIAFIDVPGHERFIKNMVAGVSTVDLILFVVAADDGVMPQTREHLDILQVLQLKHGIIAVTKTDLVEKDWLDLVHEDIRQLTRSSFLEKAPIFDVSSVSGQGVDKLKAALCDLARQTPSRKDTGIFWLPVDRSFSIKGFGTVVTGSVLSGKAVTGDSLELLTSKQIVRVRGLQSHGHDVEQVSVGMRAAVNLGGVEKTKVQRGDVLATPGYYSPALLFDAKLQLLKSVPKSLKNRTRVRIHLGTREIMGRIILLDTDLLATNATAYVQLRLESQAVASRLEPFVIRQYSPPLTIGGGVVLNANAEKHRRFDPAVIEHLKSLEHEDPGELVEGQLLTSGVYGLRLQELVARTGLEVSVVQNALANLGTDKLFQIGASQNPIYIHAIEFGNLKERIVGVLTHFHEHNPLRLGVGKSELAGMTDAQLSSQVFDSAVETLIGEKQIEERGTLLKLPKHEINLSPEDEATCSTIADELYNAGFSTPSEDQIANTLKKNRDQVRKLLGAMQGRGDVQKLEGDVYFLKSKLSEAEDILKNYFQNHEELSVSAFRELLGTSRKYAMAMLIYFDDIGVTERVGEVRILGQKYANSM